MNEAMETESIRVASGLDPQTQALVLSPDALSFVAALVRRFRGAVATCLRERQAQQAKRDTGERLAPLAETADLRQAQWRVAEPPPELQDRRVEITGPVDRKMLINALNSGARVFMADLEDATSPTWNNLIEGQRNLRDAVRRTLRYQAPETGRLYQLNEQTAVLMVRPRGWHLVEEHLVIDGEPSPAALVDAGLFLFHNAAELLSRGSGPYLYLPKLESYREAELWEGALSEIEQRLQIPTGSIRVTVLIETLPAAFQVDEILYALRSRILGLNCGRWDYIFSFIKCHRTDRSAVLPDRSAVGMDRPFLDAYARSVIWACHRRGAHAIGGMAAQIPIKGDTDASARALAAVRADKEREVALGHDGTWVAHPGLVAVAQAVFDAHMPGPHQIDRPLGPPIDANTLLEVPGGPKTEAGLRLNARVAVQYLASWLSGTGCVPIDYRMEDAATAEISRIQLWQWLRHGAVLDDGRTVTKELVDSILDEEVHLLKEHTHNQNLSIAHRLVRELVVAETPADFLTLHASSMLAETATHEE